MTQAVDFKSLSSGALFERARNVLAGGISHPNRYALPHPIYAARGRGSRRWDVEGNEYIDYSMGSASLLLGHCHPAVVAALQEQAVDGTYFGSCHPLEVEWGALIQKLVPSAERVRFVASGTEASMLAMRLARAYSGKTKVVRFQAHYNGWHDYAVRGIMAADPGPPTWGVPAPSVESTIVCRPDPQALDAVLQRDKDIAAIICEVSGASYGSVPLPDGFLGELRSLATQYEVTLIFDEVITGFRWSPGGVQGKTGVVPDMTIMAKIVAGGNPGGAVAGKKEIMDLLDPAIEFKGKKPGVFHRGTFNAAPLIAAGAIATLKLAGTGDPQRQADTIAARLREGMRVVLDEHRVAGCVYGASSTFHVYFGEKGHASIKGLSAAEIRGMPKDTVAAYQNGLRKRGVEIMSYMGGVTSSAHNDDDLTVTLKAFEEVIQDLLRDDRITRR